MLNVVEQQDDKKHLKLQGELEDADEVQEVTSVRTPMEKNQTVCVTKHWH